MYRRRQDERKGIVPWFAGRYDLAGDWRDHGYSGNRIPEILHRGYN